MMKLQFFRLGFQIFLLTWLAVGLLIWDSTTNLGIADGVLYLLVVLATLPIQNKNLTVGVIGCSTILILIGFFSSPLGMDQNYALTNRVFSILSVWITGFMVWKNIESTQSLQSLKTELEHQFEMQTMELKKQNLAMLNVLDDMKTVKDTLEEKEERLKLFIDAFPSGMVMVDETGTITLINQIMADLFGYSKEELLVSRIEQLLPERFRQIHMTRRLECMNDPNPRSRDAGRDLFGLRKDGSEFPVEIGLNPLIRGETSFVLASVVDITQRKNAESILANQNRLFMLDATLGRILDQSMEIQPLLQQYAQAIIDHLDGALACIWTLNHTQQELELQVRAGLYAHFDGPYKHIPVGQSTIGKIAADKQSLFTNDVFVDPRVPEQEWAKRMGLTACAGVPLLRDQDVLGVMVLFSKQRFSDSTLDILIMVADRLTAAIERQQILHAHQELSLRNERILASVEEGIYEVDLEGRTTFINPAGARMLGYEPQELIGLNMHLTVHHSKPDGSPYPKEDCRKHASIADGSIHKGDDEVLWRKDGTSLYMQYASSPIRDERNRICGAAVVFSDITVRKQTEQMLAMRNHELTRSNDELEQFAYIASHDLKEPLRGINNFSRMLIEDYGKDFNEDAMNKCQTLIRLSGRMENLVDSLLYYSRVGRTSLSMRSTNLDQTIQEMLDSLGVTIREQKAVIIYPKALPTVYCDSVRTGEIFLNLVTNGLKYNDKDEKRIEIGCIEDGDRLRSEWDLKPGIPVFYVKDNGIGISEKHFQNIFRIFKRLHARDKFGGGTGVGLTISKKLIERHRGKIWIDSTVGAGTTFYFTLKGEMQHECHTQPVYSVRGG